jgi:hypothetical protein
VVGEVLLMTLPLGVWGAGRPEMGGRVFRIVSTDGSRVTSSEALPTGGPLRR